MHATTEQLVVLFDTTITYQVPLFQRPYVWNEAENWEPLWEDIQSLLDKSIRGQKSHPHFIGAIVLEQVPNPAATIGTRLVIDGQQRFTTLQLFIVAARNLAAKLNSADHQKSFSDLVSNPKNRAKTEIERYKLWPTNSDRKAFTLVHGSASDAELIQSLKADPDQRHSNIVQAYQYFSSQLSEWVNGKLDDPEAVAVPDGTTQEQRLDAVWEVIEKGLQLVVINLTETDETQVIFETLNARGTVLLPADLIKNYLFRRAAAREDTSPSDVEDLYAKHWEKFETPFWREEVQQGRIKRPRIDLFINHYLTLMTRDDVRSTHLFYAFKSFVEDGVEGDTAFPAPTTPAEHIAQISRFGDVFRKFYEPGKHEALALFIRRLDAVDTATVYPVLLYAHAVLIPDDQPEFDKILAILESFLMRRLITNDTAKNYNRLFVELIKAVAKAGKISANSVAAYLARSQAESARFPTDAELLVAVSSLPLYSRLSQKKVRAVLEALDAYNYSGKSEAIALQNNLTIEHLMPQTWQPKWPFPDGKYPDKADELKATAERNILLNTLGNLTLITGKLNPALSNEPWAEKRPELLTYSRLNLTRYFRDVDVWDETAIRKRTEHLFAQLLQIWPDVERVPTDPTDSV